MCTGSWKRAVTLPLSFNKLFFFGACVAYPKPFGHASQHLPVVHRNDSTIGEGPTGFGNLGMHNRLVNSTCSLSRPFGMHVWYTCSESPCRPENLLEEVSDHTLLQKVQGKWMRKSTSARCLQEVCEALSYTHTVECEALSYTHSACLCRFGLQFWVSICASAYALIFPST
jgi:hypothetical protein